MTTWHRVIGDTNDTIVATLNGVTSLSGVSAVEAHVWYGGSSPATLTAVVTDAAACTVTVSLASWISTAAAGAWALEIQTTASGVIRTWPEKGTDTIEVRAQVG